MALRFGTRSLRPYACSLCRVVRFEAGCPLAFGTGRSPIKLRPEGDVSKDARLVYVSKTTRVHSTLTRAGSFKVACFPASVTWPETSNLPVAFSKSQTAPGRPDRS